MDSTVLRLLSKIDLMNISTENFAKFLELPEDERLQELLGIKLRWYQRIYIRYLNKWWSAMRRSNPKMKAIYLLESIRKGRF